MTGFEATNSIQPQRNIRHFKLSRKKPKGRIWAVVILFILVGFLCANNYTLLQSYKDLKSDLSIAYKEISEIKYAKEKIVSEDTELQKKYEQLADETRALKDEYNKASRGGEDLSKEVDVLKKQINELTKQNKELVHDNVALQNSLKMAAAVGVKPQSFSAFEGLAPRDTLNRGKYIGKFIGTAYTPSKEECGNNKGITKSGTPVMPGVSVAVDSRYWPFGTVFYIKGLGYTVAMDTGSAIKGKHRFDFSVFDRQFAMQLGSRKWDVYLVKLGNGKVKNVSL